MEIGNPYKRRKNEEKFINSLHSPISENLSIATKKLGEPGRQTIPLSACYPKKSGGEVG